MTAVKFFLTKYIGQVEIPNIPLPIIRPTVHKEVKNEKL